MNNNDPLNNNVNNIVNDDPNPFQDDGNPFADYSTVPEEPIPPIEGFNPFVNEETQKKEEEPKKKHGLFGRKKKDEEEVPQVTTISLKDVQSMSFPTEEQVVQQQVPVTPAVFVDPEEAKNKRKKIFKRIKKIVELVILVGLIIFGYTKYQSYSKVVNQKLTYEYGNDLFEMIRDKKDLHVNHIKKTCVSENDCNQETIEEYDIKFDKIQGFLARLYFDITFKLKSGNKTIKQSDLNGTLASKAVYSLIHNDSIFLSFGKYKDYSIMSTEQKSEYTLRGYHYEERSGHFCLAIALGQKDSNGYDISLIEMHEIDGVITIYIKEKIPTKKDQWIKETQPVLNIEFNEPVNNIKVINVNNKEEFIGY